MKTKLNKEIKVVLYVLVFLVAWVVASEWDYQIAVLENQIEGKSINHQSYGE